MDGEREREGWREKESNLGAAAGVSLVKDAASGVRGEHRIPYTLHPTPYTQRERGREGEGDGERERAGKLGIAVGVKSC